MVFVIRTDTYAMLLMLMYMPVGPVHVGEPGNVTTIDGLRFGSVISIPTANVLTVDVVIVLKVVTDVPAIHVPTAQPVQV